MAVRTQIVGAALAGLLLFATAASSQILGRDPLTPQEADQVRNTADQLNQRVPLLLSFAQVRLDQFEKIRAAPATSPGRSAQLYLMLQQYRAILAEYDDAVDDLASPPQPGGPKYKVGKVLDGVIKAEQAMLAHLQQIQNNSSSADLASYHFELQNCLDATNDSLQNAEQDRANAGKK
ncbi:MAG: hypothetical protein EPN33_12935 [Acidobacteria bacterium]|nr:MAG: hypothetical protein EPN33_12935 [Acidobacteriota bacterium]